MRKAAERPPVAALAATCFMKIGLPGRHSDKYRLRVPLCGPAAVTFAALFS
jgi:hypothetical protein